MGLDATVVSINNLLQLDFEERFASFIGDIPNRKMYIPIYQREYKWESSKVKTLVNNILLRSKFLGVITIEITNSPSKIGIVDGQQRLITLVLTLVNIYNKCAEEGEVETQTEIENIILENPDDPTSVILANESLGDFLEIVDIDVNGETQKRINLKTNPSKDIYKQKRQFDLANRAIKESLETKNPAETWDTIKQKLLDCEVLLFAQKNDTSRQQGSIEEIYIDINEKAQKLDPEDIFKGHCFALCKTDTQQTSVKSNWYKIKKSFFNMDEILSGKSDLGDLLHFYLLSIESTKDDRIDIKQNLTANGNSIITERYNTPTKIIALLKNINLYQESLIKFHQSLKLIDNVFEGIILDSNQVLGNNSKNLATMTCICGEIIRTNQNLFKLPLFYLIDSVYNDSSKLDYKKFSTFIYLYYLYMFMFSQPGASKSRDKLPHQLIKKIHTRANFNIEFIKTIWKYASSVPINTRLLEKEDTRKRLYTILDYFSVSSSNVPATDDVDLSIKFKYLPDNYNLEHLIIPQSHKVLWTNKDNSTIELLERDFTDCIHWIAPNNKWPNFIWIHDDMNRQLANHDIIYKVKLLRGELDPALPPARDTYAKKNKHIDILCKHIINTEGFSDLYDAYNNSRRKSSIQRHYIKFINNYFDPINIDELRIQIETEYKKTIDILYSLF